MDESERQRPIDAAAQHQPVERRAPPPADNDELDDAALALVSGGAAL